MSNSTNSSSKLLVSVDVDDWYFARWAFGSPHSIWPNLQAIYDEFYNGSFPAYRLQKSVNTILSLFDDLSFSSTFFFTGYVAEKMPDLVKQIDENGHEVACHNYHHLDYGIVRRDVFRKDLLKAKHLLEDITGKLVIGYRAPNSSIPGYMVKELIDAGFSYDSSVTPTRRTMGKFGDFTKAKSYPYQIDPLDLGKKGNSGMYEFPWAVFPLAKLPSGSGITHRVLGSFYNNTALNAALQKGHSSYYFHPYEISDLDELKGFPLPRKARLFLRKCGNEYLDILKQLLTHHKDRLISGRNLLPLVKESQRTAFNI